MLLDNVMCKDTATFLLLLERYSYEKRELDKNAGLMISLILRCTLQPFSLEIAEKTANLMKLLGGNGLNPVVNSPKENKQKFMIKPPKRQSDDHGIVFFLCNLTLVRSSIFYLAPESEEHFRDRLASAAACLQRDRIPVRSTSIRPSSPRRVLVLFQQ